MIGFINTFLYNLSLSQSIIALSLIYPLHKSLGHAKSSQSSLVVFWQQICNSLTVTTAHIKSSFQRPTPLYSFVLLQFLFSFYHWLPIYDWTTYIVSRRAHRKHCFLYCSEGIFTAPLPSNGSIRCRGNMFSDPLPSNGHGANHKENTSCNPFSIVVCAYFGRCLEVGLHVTIWKGTCALISNFLGQGRPLLSSTWLYWSRLGSY
jgi:hypothetical protein